MKISINLLPPEIIAQEMKKAKFYKIQVVGIGIILIMIFLTALTLTLRILQSKNIAEVKASLEKSEQKISSLKSIEESIVLLKNRLSVVNQYFGVSSKQSAMYELIDKLTPPSVVINSISVNKTSEVIVQAYVPDPVSLDNFVNNLIGTENNENKISEVAIDNLSRSRDGLYRVSFKIKPK